MKLVLDSIAILGQLPCSVFIFQLMINIFKLKMAIGHILVLIHFQDSTDSYFQFESRVDVGIDEC